MATHAQALQALNSCTCGAIMTDFGARAPNDLNQHAPRKGDYFSPGLEIIILDEFFPNMKIGDKSGISTPFFRRDIPHDWYVDRSFPECGFLNRDEAILLYNNALQFANDVTAVGNASNADRRPVSSRYRALEIGSHVGWSTVHIALAGIPVDVVEPQLNQDPRVLLSLVDSLRRARLHHAVSLHAGFSPEKVEEIAVNLKRTWNFIFIDGNHNPGYPLRDAVVAEKYADPDACMILFHDLVYPSVGEAMGYLKHHGWKTRIYNTQQILGVAWRGEIEPVTHIPDPSVTWTLPEHLEKLSEKIPERPIFDRHE